MNSLRALQGTIPSDSSLLTSHHDQSSEDASLTIDDHEQDEMDASDNGTVQMADLTVSVSMANGLDAYIDNEDDLTSYDGVAKQSRLPENEMSDQERELFPGIAQSSQEMAKFLQFRNTILQLWYQNPQTQLLLDEILARLEVNDPLSTLLRRIFFYLERNGFINFGVFRIIKFPFAGPPKKKVVIIGAGVAGLIAARQLKFFNFDVIVLESRKRIGGRIFTYRHGKYIADVGAVMLPGIFGNPLRVINKQIDMKLKSIKQKCPLFSGKKPQLITKEKDDNVETLFNNMLEATKHVDDYNVLKGRGGKPLSLDDSFNVVMALHDREVKMDYVSYCADTITLLKEYHDKVDELSNLKRVLKDMQKKHAAYVASKLQHSSREEYLFRSNRNEFYNGKKKAKKLEEAIERIYQKLNDYENKDVPIDYFDPLDQKILEWHFANLEFATNTQLKNLDLKNWDKEEYAFDGDHLLSSEGMSCLPFNLAEGVDVKLATVVRSIQLTETGVELKVVNMEKFNTSNDTKMLAKKLTTTTPTIFQADAVLCTVPMGVLKNSVDPVGESAPNSVEFIPPLPADKVESIRKLGYGNINKLVLIFDHVFWDKQTTLFGRLPETSAERGEFFMFWCASRQPVMTALIGGKAANYIEAMEDEKIKERCLEKLKCCFDKVAPLKNYYVTRWRADPWSMGGFTYCAVGSSGDDSEALSIPVAHPDEKGSAIPRLFFAGEHTVRNMLATVHGAFLSGIREAAKIADSFLEINSY